MRYWRRGGRRRRRGRGLVGDGGGEDVGEEDVRRDLRGG